MKRAFTLIELLVVIAIIAILAAILFPVFAQAKEAAKKTQSISNMKQTATGVLLYSGDADDNFPSAYSIADGGACGAGAAGHPLDPFAEWAPVTPAGADDVNCTQVDGQAWINSTQPYIKNWQMLEQPGFDKRDMWTAAYMAVVKNPTTSALTMNGYLHTYSASAVANPSGIPLVWAGTAKNNFKGGSYSANPVLKCAGTGPCVFRGNGDPSSGGAAPYQAFYYFTNATLNKVWHYGRGMIFANTDSSAKFVPVNPGGAATAPSTGHPYINFGNNGSTWSGQFTLCSTGGASTDYYAGLFRPDRPGTGGYAMAWALNQCQW